MSSCVTKKRVTAFTLAAFSHGDFHFGTTIGCTTHAMVITLIYILTAQWVPRCPVGYPDNKLPDNGSLVLVSIHVCVCVSIAICEKLLIKNCCNLLIKFVCVLMCLIEVVKFWWHLARLDPQSYFTKFEFCCLKLTAVGVVYAAVTHTL